MLKREEPKKPDIRILYEGEVPKKKLKLKKEALFVKILNRLLKLDCLKLLELSIGFVKGFAVKIEFFEKICFFYKNAILRIFKPFSRKN